MDKRLPQADGLVSGTIVRIRNSASKPIPAPASAPRAAAAPVNNYAAKKPTAQDRAAETARVRNEEFGIGLGIGAVGLTVASAVATVLTPIVHCMTYETLNAATSAGILLQYPTTWETMGSLALGIASGGIGTACMGPSNVSSNRVFVDRSPNRSARIAGIVTPVVVAAGLFGAIQLVSYAYDRFAERPVATESVAQKPTPFAATPR